MKHIFKKKSFQLHKENYLFNNLKFKYLNNLSEPKKFQYTTYTEIL